MTTPVHECQPGIVERLRKTAVFIGDATGKENARWVTEAAEHIEKLTKALQPAQLRIRALEMSLEQSDGGK